ncbi:MAG: UvrD-helicase domain-containing protein [Lachnospiraceae bacterium]|nr:UvrD-helicase domain-containing protein [Ruminococcus sp.]MCM1275413.1 UvrD-helicase domain-containing protein [Lachnospiraceae bacterium]
MDYIKLKQTALESYFSRANDMQKKAIFKINGAVLIIAGAGSGKTTVLVNRIANMMRFGNAYHDEEIRPITPEQERFLADFPSMEKTPETAARLAEIIAVNPVNPWNILAITFTNKAAGELRQRLVSMIGEDARKICAATFHSACVKILRREIEHLGYKPSFTIYDDDDSKRLIKDIMKRHDISEKVMSAKMFKNNISRLKDKLISAEDYAPMARETAELIDLKTAEVYLEYQSSLKAANAVDFDDIIFLTVRLFEDFPDVLRHYRNLYKYIMVDEYQDTNVAQYRLVSLLAGDEGNLGVVGDDDQSIYRFRGATIENILSFEKQYKNCTVIRLEQNYRSTENILNAANGVIKNNTQHKEKRLWSDLGEGEKIQINLYPSEQSEAKGIAEIIAEGVQNGAKYSDFALLYRNNALSRSYETAMTRAGIPYKIVGGLRFYDRKEIRDMLAYLSIIDNPFDAVRFRRVINEPKRGIGDATVDEVVRIAEGLNISPVEVCRDAMQYETLQRKANSLKAAANLFDELDEAADTMRLDELIEAVAEKTGYMEMLNAQGDEGKARIENINELKSNAMQLMEENPEAALPDFLEQVALVADIDNYDTEADRVSLMTMHAAKGLEFPVVFMVAAEDNIFPSMMCLREPSEMEEERRLAYVAITRAKQRLIVTHSQYRMLFGKTSNNKLSTFIREIPEELCEKHGERPKPRSFSKPERHSFLKEETAKMRTAVPRSNDEVFSVGDRVKHNIFGEGTVTAVLQTGNDAMITIDFDSRGQKKVMKNNARMTKI